MTTTGKTETTLGKMNVFYCHLNHGWIERNQDKNWDTNPKPSLFPGSASCLPSWPLHAWGCASAPLLLPAAPCPAPPRACPAAGESLGLEPLLPSSCPALPRLTSVARRHRRHRGLHCALWGLEPAGPSCVRHGAALAPPCTGPAAGSVLQGTQYHLLCVNR